MRAYGFSLLEIVITLAIIAVVASIAYPSYQYTMARSRRRQALWQLQHLASKLEHHYLHHHQYRGYSLPTALSSAYQFTLSSSQPHQFTLIATPNSQQRQYDRCGTLTIDNHNQLTSADNGYCLK